MPPFPFRGGPKPNGRGCGAICRGGVAGCEQPEAYRPVSGQRGYRVGCEEMAPNADQHRVDRNACNCARRRRMGTEGARRRHLARRLEPDEVLHWC